MSGPAVPSSLAEMQPGSVERTTEAAGEDVRAASLRRTTDDDPSSRDVSRFPSMRLHSEQSYVGSDDEDEPERLLARVERHLESLNLRMPGEDEHSSPSSQQDISPSIVHSHWGHSEEERPMGYGALPSPSAAYGSLMSPASLGRSPTSIWKSDKEEDLRKLQETVEFLKVESQYLLDKLLSTEGELQDARAQIAELQKQQKSKGKLLGMDSKVGRRRINKSKSQSRRSAGDLRNLEELREDAEVAAEEDRLAAVKADQEQIFRNASRRLNLSPEEEEELMLKRCWLARYWMLAEEYAVHPELAQEQAAMWHSQAPIPFEVVYSAGQRAKEKEHDSAAMGSFGRDSAAMGNVGRDSAAMGSVGRDSDVGDFALAEEERFEDRTAHSFSAASSVDGEEQLSLLTTFENLLQVERALRIMSALRVEEQVLLAMAQRKSSTSTYPRSPGKGLSEDEAQDIRFKQHWLLYFWWRAKTSGVEVEAARAQLSHWALRCNFEPEPFDVADVEAGLTEMRQRGIEQKLWETSRAVQTISRQVSSLSTSSTPRHPFSGRPSSASSSPPSTHFLDGGQRHSFRRPTPPQSRPLPSFVDGGSEDEVLEDHGAEEHLPLGHAISS
eukprot:TRINITY_DN20470_c0_g1_i1.p1 TRINITY_DN20470_c0_g1~~TRINITY_DN20470_c0_g1_i1.p1  ORF type:complete len:613 (-),score=142.42 TRINITY_DN20470_c0_g1_i1:908-2746(-)